MGTLPELDPFGIDCPGCGGLRGVNDLTNLRFADAASSNLLLAIAMPFAVFFLARWAVDAWRGVRRTPKAPSHPADRGGRRPRADVHGAEEPRTVRVAGGLTTGRQPPG